MKVGEREELERQGAKAAARGDAPQVNPMLKPCNTPDATGEPPEQWRERLEAWQSGFEAQARVAKSSTTGSPEPADTGNDSEEDPGR